MRAFVVLVFALLCGVAFSTLCQDYASALFGTDDLSNELRLMYTVVNDTIDNILLNPFVAPYFTGGCSGCPDVTSRVDPLKASLVAFFGGALGCKASGFPQYTGPTMHDVHKAFKVSKDAFENFNLVLLDVLNGLGMGIDDLNTVAQLLDGFRDGLGNTDDVVCNDVSDCYSSPYTVWVGASPTADVQTFNLYTPGYLRVPLGNSLLFRNRANSQHTVTQAEGTSGAARCTTPALPQFDLTLTNLGSVTLDVTTALFSKNQPQPYYCIITGHCDADGNGMHGTFVPIDFKPPPPTPSNPTPAPSAAPSANSGEFAICTLKGTVAAPNAQGSVKFARQTDGRIRVTVEADKLVDNGLGQIAIHIHQFGDMSLNLLTGTFDGSAAGGHYVGVANNPHGCPPNDTRHVGDMGNWVLQAGGKISQTKDLDLMSLYESGDSIIGRSVVIHSGVDDCFSQPTGSSGIRLAQCVIGVGAPLTANPPGLVRAANTGGAGIAIMKGLSACGGCNGTVWIEEINLGEFRVTARFNGLKNNSLHGFHIHTYGDMSSNSGDAAGGHYNPPFPQNGTHGLPQDPGHHIGDWGYIQSYEPKTKTAWYQYSQVLNATLQELIGRPFIVHELKDNGRGFGCGETGGAGARFMMGVIGVINPINAVPPVPIFVNNNWFPSDCDDKTRIPNEVNIGPLVGAIVGGILAFIILSVLVALVMVGLNYVDHWENEHKHRDSA